MSKEAVEKPKIEAIYPLTLMQQGILFHHLTETNDKGFLNVQCTIDGDLNVDIFKQSWDLAIERHPVLRTSVHWEKIKKPVQIVKPKGAIQWHISDWSDKSTDTQEQQLSKLKDDNKNRGLDFQKSPLSEINLVKSKKNSHYLIWSCHHLLLDGWSSSIILRDVFAFYEALSTHQKPALENIPSYKSYLNHLKKIGSNGAKEFWSTTFEGYENPFLFNKSLSKIGNLAEHQIHFSESLTSKAHELAKSFQITINTLFQGVWSIILAKYSNSDDVCFGNTVSGRSGNFPNIELMAGMFANVLPVRAKINTDKNIKDWLKNLQSQQLEARKYEHCSIGEIIEWTGNTLSHLFDSLYIFENFPWDNINIGNIKVHSSKSGITTAYPLTLTIKKEAQITLQLLSDTTIFPEETNLWFLDRFKEIIDAIHGSKGASITSVLKKITTIEAVNNKDQTIELPRKVDTIKSPKNKTELELLKIWETLFGRSNISTTDNYFEIGGKSLMAAKMFSSINKNMGTQLSPTTLLEHPTIEGIASLMKNETSSSQNAWNNLAPIRAKGNKAPLFCLHAGGGHVFFYQPLAKHLDKRRPVYAIRPSGLFGKLKRHNNIEDMAKDYIKEIRMAYPEGPYNLLVYCHSTAVGFEMANLLKNMGCEANLIVLDTMAEQENITEFRLKMRVLGFLKRFGKHPFKVISTFVKFRFDKYVKPFLINKFGSTENKNTINTAMHLIKIYNQYQWKPYDVDISLVLTKKVNGMFNKEVIRSWEKLANKLEIVNTEGDHRTLLEEPDVKFVAKALDEHLKQ